jgi:hypothetical protein
MKPENLMTYKTDVKPDIRLHNKVQKAHKSHLNEPLCSIIKAEGKIQTFFIDALEFNLEVERVKPAL